MIGIAGASGLIGYSLYNFLRSQNQEVLGTYAKYPKDGLVKFDMRKDDFSIFDRCSTVVISAGITRVEECFLRQEETFEINVKKTIELLRYLADRKIKPVFLSSGQVFDGKRGNYSEEDVPNPINFYGKFKVQVEEFMKDNLMDYLILRLSKTYSRDLGSGGLFSEIYFKLKRNEKVGAAYNQIYNPTDVSFVSAGILKSIQRNLTCLYHLASEKIMSRYEFALQVADEFKFDRNLIESIDFNSLVFKEKNALNTSLNVVKIMRAIEIEPKDKFN